MNAAESATQSFVVLHIGERRFGLPSEAVVELAPPVRLYRFPHASRLITGVIVRRGRIVPVYDASSILIGRSSSGQRFYLIARRRAGSSIDLGAIPVNGECELASGEMALPEDSHPAWVAGKLALSGEFVDVIDFAALASSNAGATGSPSAERP